MTYKYFLKHIKEFTDDQLTDLHTKLMDTIPQFFSQPATRSLDKQFEITSKLINAIETELKSRSYHHYGV